MCPTNVQQILTIFYNLTYFTHIVDKFEQDVNINHLESVDYLCYTYPEDEKSQKESKLCKAW